MRKAAFFLLASLLLAGCGTGFQDPGVTRLTVTDELRTVCSDYISDHEIEGLIWASEANREQGFTRAEVLTDVFTVCEMNAGSGALECIDCASAIVNQVYSN